MPDTAGAAAAPTLVPTSLPVCSPPPTAFIQASVLAVTFPSASDLPPVTANAAGSIQALRVDTGPP